MKLNEHTGKSKSPYHLNNSSKLTQYTNTALSTTKVLLVPYFPHHVPTYHTWMQDLELQAATASEPLTLPEEYEMQRSWRTDHDKLTFIVCLPLDDKSRAVKALASQDDQPERMIGDINLFLSDPEDDEDEPASAAEGGGIIGEIELMIARKDLHRQGYGRAALLTFLDYIFSSWDAISWEYGQGDIAQPLRYLRVKINQDNARSIALFESIGFAVAKEANYFGEVELRWRPDRKALEGGKGWEKAREVRYSEPV